MLTLLCSLGYAYRCSISIGLQWLLNRPQSCFCAVVPWLGSVDQVLIPSSNECFAKITSVVHNQVQAALRCHNTLPTRTCWQPDEMDNTLCAIPMKCQECESHSRGWLAYRHPPPPTAKQLVLSVILMLASCQQLLLVGRDSRVPTTMFSMLSARINPVRPWVWKD